ncbi:hypothetical protein [Bradyrhizobium sp. USDA 4502]
MNTDLALKHMISTHEYWRSECCVSPAQAKKVLYPVSYLAINFLENARDVENRFKSVPNDLMNAARKSSRTEFLLDAT